MKTKEICIEKILVMAESITHDELIKKFMDVCNVIKFADKELNGDYNWEITKRDAGLPSELGRSKI